jgi:hypothetical protein
MQGPLLDADCSSCKVALSNAVLTSVGNLGGTDRLGGKAALNVHNSTLHGMALEAEADVTVSLITSRCGNCTISSSALASKMVIVNSEFDPALTETSQRSLASCIDLQQRLGVCDRSAECSNNATGGRQCRCPFGSEPGAEYDGTQCIDLCTLAKNQPVYLEDSRTPISSDHAIVNDSAHLDFSGFASIGTGVALEVRLVPKEGVRSLLLANTAALLQTGLTRAGAYELQLRSAAKESAICTLVETLDVQCTQGLSAADADGTPCMPVISITAASIRIKSSAGVVVFDGQLRKGSLGAGQPRPYALVPIAAGDKLTVAVTVRDIHGAPVNRSTLGLSMVLKGTTTSKEAPFEPPTKSRSTFELTVSEMWIPEPGEVQSALHAAVAVQRKRLMPSARCTSLRMRTAA